MKILKYIIMGIIIYRFLTTSSIYEILIYSAIGIVVWFLFGFIVELYKTRKYKYQVNYHENGRVKEKYFLNEDSKLQDMYEEYDINGILRKRIFYNNGLKDGLYQEYDVSGKLIKRVYYKDDKIIEE